MDKPTDPLLPPGYIDLTKAITGFLSIIVPVCSTLSGCLTYQFIHYISQVKEGDGRHTSTLIAFFTWVTNLIGMVFEIIIFRSFAHHALVDRGFITIHNWSLTSLAILNYLTATFSRIYFARIASTMLRSPKAFLCLSGILLVASLGGVLIEVVHMNLAITRDSQSFQDLSYRIRSFGLQALWMGSALIWDGMICGVLLYNLFDQRRRFRFGSIDGKLTFVIILFFESFGLATFTTILSVIMMIALDFRLSIDYGRLSVVYSALTSFATRFCGISILCSLQHKVLDHLRFDQKLMTSSTLPQSIRTQSALRPSQETTRRPMREQQPVIKFPKSTADLIFLNNDGVEKLTDEYEMINEEEEERHGGEKSRFEKETTRNSATTSTSSSSLYAQYNPPVFDSTLVKLEQDSLPNRKENDNVTYLTDYISPRGSLTFEPRHTPVSFPRPTFQPDRSSV